MLYGIPIMDSPTTTPYYPLQASTLKKRDLSIMKASKGEWAKLGG